MLLKFLRKRKNMKRIMWALAILIIPAFVIWGAGTSGKKREKGPDYAGKIFNRKVSFEEYLDMWRVSRDYAIKTFGAEIPPEFIDQLAWNRILLLEASKRKNITVKDSEVVERIASFPIFQKEGKLNKKLYKSMVGDSARGFEERLRDDIRIAKLRKKVTASVSVTDEEITESYKKDFEKIKASYISIPFSDFEKDVRYQESGLIKFYEKNKEAFRRPEEVNIKYIEVLFDDFDKEALITEEQIKSHFEERRSNYKKPDPDEIPTLDETIKKEIFEELASQKKKSLAEELAYKVLDKVLDKKNLDEAVRIFALKTKETGFFNMQQEIPGIGWSYEFTKTGFELKPGGISNSLIKTDRGFYVTQLKERKASYLPKFSEIKNAVISSFIKNKSIKLAEKNAKKLYITIANKRKSGRVLEDIVKEPALELKETGFISRSDYMPMLGPAREAVDVCSSLKNGEIAGPIKMLESWVILRLDGYQDIDEAKFLKEKEDFKENLLSRKKDTAFTKWFEELKKGANFVSYTLK